MSMSLASQPAPANLTGPQPPSSQPSTRNPTTSQPGLQTQSGSISPAQQQMLPPGIQQQQAQGQQGGGGSVGGSSGGGPGGSQGQSVGGPSHQHPGGHGSHGGPPKKTGWESDKMLNVYIYDYCLKRNFTQSARAFFAEAQVPQEQHVPIDAPEGFLYEWWIVFWDIFSARANKSGSREAVTYVEAQNLRSQRDRELRGRQMSGLSGQILGGPGNPQQHGSVNGLQQQGPSGPQQPPTPGATGQSAMEYQGPPSQNSQNQLNSQTSPPVANAMIDPAAFPMRGDNNPVFLPQRFMAPQNGPMTAAHISASMQALGLAGRDVNSLTLQEKQMVVAHMNKTWQLNMMQGRSAGWMDPVNQNRGRSLSAAQAQAQAHTSMMMQQGGGPGGQHLGVMRQGSQAGMMSPPMTNMDLPGTPSSLQPGTPAASGNNSSGPPSQQPQSQVPLQNSPQDSNLPQSAIKRQRHNSVGSFTPIMAPNNGPQGQQQQQQQQGSMGVQQSPVMNNVHPSKGMGASSGGGPPGGQGMQGMAGMMGGMNGVGPDGGMMGQNPNMQAQAGMFGKGGWPGAGNWTPQQELAMLRANPNSMIPGGARRVNSIPPGMQMQPGLPPGMQPGMPGGMSIGGPFPGQMGPMPGMPGGGPDGVGALQGLSGLNPVQQQQMRDMIMQGRAGTKGMQMRMQQMATQQITMAQQQLQQQAQLLQGPPTPQQAGGPPPPIGHGGQSASQTNGTKRKQSPPNSQLQPATPAAMGQGDGSGQASSTPTPAQLSQIRMQQQQHPGGQHPGMNAQHAAVMAAQQQAQRDQYAAAAAASGQHHPGLPPGSVPNDMMGPGSPGDGSYHPGAVPMVAGPINPDPKTAQFLFQQQKMQQMRNVQAQAQAALTQMAGPASLRGGPPSQKPGGPGGPGLDANHPDASGLAPGDEFDQLERLLAEDGGIEAAFADGMGDWLAAGGGGPPTATGGGEDDPMGLMMDAEFGGPWSAGGVAGGGSNGAGPGMAPSAAGAGGGGTMTSGMSGRPSAGASAAGHNAPSASQGAGGMAGTGAHPGLTLEMSALRPIADLAGHTAKVQTCSFDGTGCFMASAGHDKKVQLWDIRRAATTGEVARMFTLEGHTQQITGARWLHLGRLAGPDAATLAEIPVLLATSSYDKTVRVWELRGAQRFAMASSDASSSAFESPEIVTTFGGHARSVTSVDFCPLGVARDAGKPGRKVVLWCGSLDAEGEVKVWEVWTGTAVKSLKLPQSSKSSGYSANPLRFRPLRSGTPCQSVFVATAFSNSLHLVEITSDEDAGHLGEEKVTTIPTAHAKNISTLDWSTCGNWLVTSSDDVVVLWDASALASGSGGLREAAKCGSQTGKISSCAFLQAALPPDDGRGQSLTGLSTPPAFGAVGNGNGNGGGPHASPLTGPPRVVFGEYEGIFMWDTSSAVAGLAGPSSQFGGGFGSVPGQGTGRGGVAAFPSAHLGVVSCLSCGRTRGSNAAGGSGGTSPDGSTAGGGGSSNGALLLGSASGAKEKNLKVWQVNV